MKVQLLVSKWCPTCPQAETVWQEIAKRRPIELEILDVGEKDGREIVSRMRIRTVPALIIDGILKSVGVQPLGDALQFVDEGTDVHAHG